jgi:plastocyanin
MKYFYILLALIFLAISYYGFTVYSSKSEVDQGQVTVKEGFHLMPDGSLMPNEQSVENMNGTENTVPQEENIDDTKNVQQSTITLDPNARVFTLTGVNFGYDVQEIVVQEGDTVTINFESTDGLHDVIIDEFAVATKRVQPGVKTSVTFVADKKGTFEYYCSVGQHRSKGMVGKLIVE